MRVAVVVAVTGGGVVRGFVMHLAIVMAVAVLFIVGFGASANIAIGVGGSVLMLGGIGLRLGLAAGEEAGWQERGVRVRVSCYVGYGWFKG